MPSICQCVSEILFWKGGLYFVVSFTENDYTTPVQLHIEQRQNRGFPSHLATFARVGEGNQTTKRLKASASSCHMMLLN